MPVPVLRLPCPGIRKRLMTLLADDESCAKMCLQFAVFETWTKQTTMPSWLPPTAARPKNVRFALLFMNTTVLVGPTASDSSWLDVKLAGRRIVGNICGIVRSYPAFQPIWIQRWSTLL